MRFALAAAVLAAALGAQAGPVAFVADVRGSATIEGDGKLDFLAELPAGTRVLLGTGAAASIAFAGSGAEYEIKGPGRFRIDEREVAAENGAPPAARKGVVLLDRQVIARVGNAARASSRMRGGKPSAAGPLALEYPGEARIATLEPQMRWRSQPAAAVTLAVRSSTGREVWKGPVTGNAARLPVRLSPGERYAWTVTAADGAVAEGRFETLPAEALARVAAARSAGRSFAHRVKHAMVLEELGAVQDARDAWAQLARERPDLVELQALAR